MFIHSIYRLQVNYIFIFIDTKSCTGYFADVRNVFSGSQPSMLSLQIIDRIFPVLLVSLITTCRDSDTIVKDLSASASAGVVPALGFWVLAQKSCLLSMPSKLNRFTAIIARGLMGLFLSPMGFRSMPVTVQLGRGLGATHGRWSCDRGGKERTRSATSEVYTRKLSKLLKKKKISEGFLKSYHLFGEENWLFIVAPLTYILQR